MPEIPYKEMVSIKILEFLLRISAKKSTNIKGNIMIMSKKRKIFI